LPPTVVHHRFLTALLQTATTVLAAASYDSLKGHVARKIKGLGTVT
jgi:hypothetical protein